MARIGARLSRRQGPRETCACGRNTRPATTQIRIDRNGAWYHEGGLIGRKELVCLFASVLRREPDGSYWLETPVERGRIEVEDAPFVAVELWWKDCDCGDGRPRQCLTFRTNLDQLVTADAEHPIRVHLCPKTREPRPYVTRPARPGGQDQPRGLL